MISWFCVAVEIGLQRSKPQWRWMIGGHPSMATGWWRGRSNRKVCMLAVGRDTADGRGGWDERHGCGWKKITSDG
jgi:hypothetical protein